jgi:hypothetical protein
MKHKKIIILSLIAVMFAAVISAITVIKPQTAKADSETHMFNYCSPFLEYVVDRSSDTPEVVMRSSKHIPYDGVEQPLPSNSIFFLMYTTDLSKYLSMKTGSFITRKKSKVLSSTFNLDEYLNSNTSYYITLEDFIYTIIDYCDDGQYYSKNVKFSNENLSDYVFKTKYLYILHDSIYENCAGGTFVRASFKLPSDLDKTYYFYSVQMELSKSYSHSGNPYSINLQEDCNIVSISPYIKVSSLRNDLLDVLENDNVSGANRDVYQQALGIYTGNKSMPVTVKYKECVGYGDIREAEKQFVMDSRYAQVKEQAIAAMYNQLDGINNIYSFDCVYNDVKWLYNDGKDYVIDSGQKTILQAKDFSYEYNGCESAVLTVNYETFRYSDFGIRVTNNDPTNNLTLDIYKTDMEKSSVYYTLIFDYETINTWVHNRAGWLVSLKKASFSADGVIVNKNNKVVVTVGETALKVKVPIIEQNALMDLRISVVAEIVEDSEVTYTVNYTKLIVDDAGNITAEDVATTPETCFYSEYENKYVFNNIMNVYGETVNSAVSPTELGGVACYVPYNARSEALAALNYKIVIEYKYQTLMRVKENGVFKRFVSFTSGQLEYSLDDLGVVVPNGYRVSNLTFSKGQNHVFFNDKNPDDAYLYAKNIAFDTSEIFDVNVELTDKLLVSVDYLENYKYKDVNGATKPSGFAVRKNEMKEVEASSFADVYSPTEAEIKTFLGVNDLTVIGTLGKVDLTNSTVEKQGAVYKIELAYWYATVKQIQSSGDVDFCNVPLRSYETWCSLIGKDWSLLVLNSVEKIGDKEVDKIVFSSNGDVDKSDLYGYFYVSVFQERVKDLNSWFAGYTSGGCWTICKEKKVKGSDLYKLCNKLGFVGFFCTVGVTGVLQVLEESLVDESGTYYTYFSFIDGSSTLSYAARNKADDYYDIDGAFDNTVEDVKDTVTNWWNSNNFFVKAMKVAFGIAGVALILLLILKILPVFIKAFGKIGKSVEEIRPDRRPKKRKRK